MQSFQALCIYGGYNGKRVIHDGILSMFYFNTRSYIYIKIIPIFVYLSTSNPEKEYKETG